MEQQPKLDLSDDEIVVDKPETIVTEDKSEPTKEAQPEPVKEIRMADKELRLAVPSAFKGDRSKLNAFKSAVQLYLNINAGVYNTDARKIAFLLSLLQEGGAALWREQWLDKHISDLSKTSPNIPTECTWDVFLQNFSDAFEETDTPGTALWRIKNMQQGTTSAEDHVNRFKLLASTSGLDTTTNKDLAIRDYFAETLNRPLRKRILEDSNPPRDIDSWYKMAIRYDNQWRRNRDIFGRDSHSKGQSRSKGKTWTWQHSSSSRDPNAMEIDALSVEERADLLKKGACFFCKAPGHMANKCPKKRSQPSNANTSTNWRTKTPKEIAAHIRSLLDEAGEETEVEVRRIAEEEGF